MKRYGVTSFKYFMNFKGEEGRYMGLDGTDDGYLYALLAESARVGRPTMVLHTENIEIVNRLRREMQAAGGADAEGLGGGQAADHRVGAVDPRHVPRREAGRARLLPAHLLARGARRDPPVAAALRRRHLRDLPALPDAHHELDLGGRGRANPPFRTKDDQDALWEALADGTADVVASDHVPRKKATKDKPLWLASQGFPGTATILPVLLSEGYHKKRLSLAAHLPAPHGRAGEDLPPRPVERAASRRAPTPISRSSISARSAR